MSCVAVNTGQLFRYGADLPFVDNFVVEMLIDVAEASRVFSSSHNGWCNTTIDIGFWEAAMKYAIKLDAEDRVGNGRVIVGVLTTANDYNSNWSG